MLITAAGLAAITAPAQDWAKARLEKSPRHQEWVKIKQGNRELQCFVVYPEVKDKATAVVLIHEIYGLSDWARGLADELAAAGYIAIAPDYLSGMAPKGGGTSEFSGQSAVVKAVSSLPASQVVADVNAAVDYAAKLPSCTGKVTVAGFCWGGGQAFNAATQNRDIKAAFVFYGIGPNSTEDIARIRCPVYGCYAGNDNRVTSTVEKSSELMKAAGKTYEPVTYDGAGHGFMRAGEAPDASAVNRKARDEAWQRWLGLLKKI